MNCYLEEALAMKDDLVTWRRAFHQIPELGLQLPQTVQYLTAKLEEMGIAYSVMEDCSCVTALIGQGEPCILLRGDMDALPVPEASGEPFSSTNGYMHACGHDFHVTSLLGAAKLLKAHEKELKGTVKLLFQSGEETFEGAKAAIENGLLIDPAPKAAFAMHVIGSVPVGTFSYGVEALSAVYGFRIKITGKGTHGSAPETGISPINTGVHIYLALQELIAREVAASQEAALTIGHFEAGKANNVIPNEALLEGTLRTFKPEVNAYLKQRITEVCESIALAYRSKVEIEVVSDCPAQVNDPDTIAQCLESAKKVAPEDTFVNGSHAMASEDFAFISNCVPSAYFSVGAAPVEAERRYGQHNPHIVFNEVVLPKAAAIYTQVAMDWLEKNS